MNKEMTLTGISLLMLISTISHAEGNAEAINARTLQQSQMQLLSNEERTLYKQLNVTGDGGGNGNMNRYRKGDSSGSGNKNRYGQAESSDYGTGYSSRQRNASGGDRGRSH